MPGTRFYLPQLDGLRFFAFLLVFIHHAPNPFDSDLAKRLHSFGWIGVDLFFVLSAFLMTSLLLREYESTGTISIAKFYARRILRIWPLYFFAVFIGFFVVPTASWTGWPEYYKLIKVYLLPYLTFTANVPISIKGYPSISFPALAHLWTISFEEQFYLVLPVLLLSLAPFKPGTWLRTLLFVFLVGFAVRASLRSMNVSYLSAWVLPFARPDSFIVGMMIALGWKRCGFQSRWSRFGLFLIATILLSLALSFPNINLNSIHNLWQYTAISLFMGAVLLSALRQPSFLATFLANGALKYLGKISYGLYVYHLLALAVTNNLTSDLSPGIIRSVCQSAQPAVALMLTIAVSAASYRWLEKPFLNRKEQYEVIPSRRA